MKRGPNKKAIDKSSHKRARTEKSPSLRRIMLGSLLENFHRILNRRSFLFLSLPQEIQLYIMQYLSPSDIIQCALTCREIEQLSNDNTLWKKVALENGVKLKDWMIDDDKLYKNLLKNCLDVRKNYPQEIKEIFEDETELAKLPVLNQQLKWGVGPEYTDFSWRDLKGHKIMRGITSNSEPFVAFCVKVEKPAVTEIEVYSYRVSHCGDPFLTYQNGKKMISFYKGNPLHALRSANAQIQDYFRRLIRNESCQPLAQPFNLTMMDLPSRNKATLTDQTEFEIEPASSFSQRTFPG